MAPKKGKKKGSRKRKPKDPNAPKVKKLKPVPDGLKPVEMSVGQLLGFIKRLDVEKGREIMEKNLFLLEKSKLAERWELLMDLNKQLISEVQRTLLEEEKAEHEKFVEQEYENQKLRYMQSEETKNFGQIRLNHLALMRRISDEMWEIEQVLQESAFVKRQQVRRQLEAHYDTLRGLHSSHSRRIQDMLIQLSNALFNKEMEWERTFVSRQDTQTESITEKNLQLFGMKMNALDFMDRSHEKFLLELQTYFNDMTANNFVVMDTIQKELESAKMLNNRLRRDLANSKKKYEDVVKPLVEAQKELVEWEPDVESFQLVWDEWMQNKERQTQIRRKAEHCESVVEVLKQQIELASAEREGLRKAVAKMMLQHQKQCGMRHFTLKLEEAAALKDAEFLTNLRLAKTGNPTLYNQSHAKFIQTEETIAALMTSGTKKCGQDLQFESYSQAHRYAHGGSVNLKNTLSLPRSAESTGLIPIPSTLGHPSDFTGKAQGIRTMLRKCRYPKGIRQDSKCTPMGFGMCYYQDTRKRPQKMTCGQTEDTVPSEFTLTNQSTVYMSDDDSNLLDQQRQAFRTRKEPGSPFYLAAFYRDEIDGIISKRGASVR